MDKEELKEKASAALSIGVAAAKKLGNAACELSKEGIAVAKVKAQEMREAREAQKTKEMEEPAVSGAPLAGLSGFDDDAPRSHYKAIPSFDGASDAGDKRFTVRGWLLFVYWLSNIVYIIGGVSACYNMAHSHARDVREAVWIPYVLMPLLLIFNRIWYEMSIAIFEIVKHLRQIRDELRSRNA